MQTFLPYSNFVQSAKVLDRQRLGKQRLEALVILRILSNEYQGKGWRNHPATKMWFGHKFALAEYGIIVCEEWISRGYKDNMLPLFKDYCSGSKLLPKWIGDQRFHDSHKSNLLRKDFNHYSIYDDFLLVGPDLPYVWPVQEFSQ